MLAFEEALALVLQAASRAPSESIPLTDCVGRALHEAVAADLDLPPFDTTAMDGWAVHAADVPVAPGILVRAGVIGAGGEAVTLPRGHAVKVMTGAPMPAGADAVVPVELAELLDDGRVRLDEAPRPGAHVRRQGEVFPRGTPLLPKGRPLTPADLVLAAGAGRDRLRVARRIQALIAVTGDEIVPAGETPGPGQIRNTNEPLLLGAFSRCGANARSLGVLRDDRAVLAAGLSAALAERPDLLVTTGGVSAGDFDLVSVVLHSLGAETLFHKVSIRPAKPILFARRGETLIFGLPGNPVSAAVAFDFFIRPAMRRSWGLSPALPPAVEAGLQEPIRNKGPRLALLPARTQHAGGRLLVSPIETRGSHDVLAHSGANAYLSLPPASAFERGDLVAVYLATPDTTLG